MEKKRLLRFALISLLFLSLIAVVNAADTTAIRKPDIYRNIIDDYAKFTAENEEVVSENLAGAVYKYAKANGIIIYTKKRSDSYCTYDFEKGIRHCEVPVEILTKGDGKNKLNSFSVNFIGLEKYDPEYFYSTDYNMAYDVMDLSEWKCIEGPEEESYEVLTDLGPQVIRKQTKLHTVQGNYKNVEGCTRLTEQYIKVSKKRFYNYRGIQDLSQLDLTHSTSILAKFDMPISDTVHYNIEIKGRIDPSVLFTKIVLDPEIGIADCDDLDSIRDDLSGNYFLSNDINCNVPPYNTGLGFDPIGPSFSNKFTGTFDGKNHTIHGLFINKPEEFNVGLFGYTGEGSEIRNVGLMDINVMGSESVGGLVGRNEATITGSYSTGDVKGTGDLIGGLVGVNYGVITGAYFLGDVKGGGAYVGGLVGSNYKSALVEPTISESYSVGTVSGSTYYLDGKTGGLVGINSYGTVIKSYSAGSVSGGPFIGGLVGYNKYGTIIESYSTANVSSNNWHVGGLVGRNYGGDDYPRGKGVIINCYATGNVSAVPNGYGGLVGTTRFGTISNSYSMGIVNRGLLGWAELGPEDVNCNNCFWDINTSEIIESDCGTGKTTAEMKEQATFTNWDFTGMWNIVEDKTYPFLRFFGRTLNPYCLNSTKDNDETDTDCGGSCLQCDDGKNCLENSDCISNYCNANGKCDIQRDLYIEWIKPVQVVEDVPLVVGKATVVRVKVVNNGPETDTDVSVNYGNGCYMETKRVTIPAYASKIVDFYPKNECTHT